MLRAVLVLGVVSMASAHLCLLEPTQRGSMQGINKAGATDCILLKAPCGDRSGTGEPSLAFKAGSNVTILFMKNLSHFNTQKPGYFSVSIGNSYPGLKEVGMRPDDASPSLTIYSMNVTIPAIPDPFQIIQVQYVTNNPQAPPVFYQCADFRIY